MLRKEESVFSFETVDAVRLIQADHWNSVVSHGSEYLKLPYLQVWEHAHPENMRYHYTIIYKTSKPVAIAYFQVIDFNGENFESLFELESEAMCHLLGYFQKKFTNQLKRNADKRNMRLLVCGNSFISGQHGFTCSVNDDKIRLIDALADVMYDIEKIEKVRGKITATLIKDFYNTTNNPLDELTEFNYHDFLAEPNMILTTQWDTFEGYLNAMSKKYRHRAKAIITKGEIIRRKVFSLQDIQDNAAEIYQLYLNVHDKAKFRMAVLPINYFEELKRQLKEDFIFVAYYLEDKLIGFRTTFILQNEIEAHFVGVNYDVNKEVELYQNMLYDYVKEAVAAQTSQLILGRTASEIKSCIGAEAVALKCYIRHHNPLSNRIIKPFVDYLKPTEWIPRKPFKEMLPEQSSLKEKTSKK